MSNYLNEERKICTVLFKNTENTACKIVKFLDSSQENIEMCCGMTRATRILRKLMPVNGNNKKIQ